MFLFLKCKDYRNVKVLIFEKIPSRLEDERNMEELWYLENLSEIEDNIKMRVKEMCRLTSV